MKKILKKVLAGLMTWIIAFQIIPMTAYASEDRIISVDTEDVYKMSAFREEYNAYYKNCTVSAYLSDPGVISYTGGMIGDTISYWKSGTFYNREYGNYMNVGVLPGYETDVAFLSTSSNEVLVLGKATGLLYIGELVNTVLEKEVVLRIKLNANASPTVEFGYLNDIIN